MADIGELKRKIGIEPEPRRQPRRPRRPEPSRERSAVKKPARSDFICRLTSPIPSWDLGAWQTHR